MNNKLSILICGLDEREDKRNILIDKLNKQINGMPAEVLCISDNREIATGEKRNRLVEKASGNYVCFVDDDDDIHDEYVEKILKAIENNPDCVGIKGIITVNNISREFIHSIECGSWYESHGVYYRTPNHLNPIKRSIVKNVMFNQFKYIGEDHEFSDDIYPYLKTEQFIHGDAIYYYNYEMNK